MRVFSKNKSRRARLNVRNARDHKEQMRHVKVEVKQHHKYLMRNPVIDCFECDDLSYVPFRIIKGTIKLPGQEPGPEYVAQ